MSSAETAIQLPGVTAPLHLGAHTLEGDQYDPAFKGIFNAAIPGIRPVPKPQLLDTAKQSVHAASLSQPGTTIPATFVLPAAVSKARLLMSDFRMGYSLVAYRKGVNAHEESVGRTWLTHFPLKVTWADSTSWDSKPIALHPGVASLAADIMDRNALSALGNITRLFGEVKSEHVGTTARAAIRTLPRTPVSHFRLLCRYMSLYLAADIAEASGNPLEFQGFDGNAPEVSAVTSIARLNALLTKGYAGRTNILYLENIGLSAFTRDAILIAYIVAGAQPHLTTSSGTAAPSVLQFWPESAPIDLAILQDDKLPELDPAIISAGTVWEAAMLYARQHNCTDQLKEAFETVLFWAWRPEGANAMMSWDHVIVSLPPLDLRPCALGPLMTGVRTWNTATQPLPQPSLEYAANAAVVKHGMLELCWQTILMEQGARDAVQRNANRGFISTLQRLCVGTGDATPMLHRVAELLGEFGLQSILGRSMASLSLPISRDSLRALVFEANSTVQWEEMLPFVEKYPAASNIMGLLRPVRITTTDVLGLWCDVKLVEGRLGLADAFYSMRLYGQVQYAQAVTSAAAGATNLRAYHPPANYRGQLADHAFYMASAPGATSIKPLFRVTNRDVLMRAYAGASKRAQWEWYIDWERDHTFEGILAMYGQPAVQAPATVGPPGRAPSSIGKASAAVPPQHPVPGVGPIPKPPLPLNPKQSLPPTARESKGSGLPLRLTACVEKVVAASGMAPPWLESLEEAYKLQGDPAHHADVIRELRAVAGGLDALHPAEFLSMLAFDDRATVAAALQSAAGMALDLAGVVKGVDVLPYITGATAYGNLATSLKLCPALTPDEWTSISPKLKTDMLPPEDVMKTLLAKGIPHGEMAALGASDDWTPALNKAADDAAAQLREYARTHDLPADVQQQLPATPERRPTPPPSPTPWKSKTASVAGAGPVGIHISPPRSPPRHKPLGVIPPSPKGGFGFSASLSTEQRLGMLKEKITTLGQQGPQMSAEDANRLQSVIANEIELLSKIDERATDQAVAEAGLQDIMPLGKPDEAPDSASPPLAAGFSSPRGSSPASGHSSPLPGETPSHPPFRHSPALSPSSSHSHQSSDSGQREGVPAPIAGPTPGSADFGGSESLSTEPIPAADTRGMTPTSSSGSPTDPQGSGAALTPPGSPLPDSSAGSAAGGSVAITQVTFAEPDHTE
ncbi:capsid protein [Phytophthora condilina RNA virus 2]|nr:capsid protein [Phytophthora condilina RNA virus 2]